MLQRIQSVWLLLAATCAFLTLKLPFYSGNHREHTGSYELFATENYLLMGLTIAVGVVAFLAIFMYKNRTTQLRLCVLGILLEAVLIFLNYRETRNFIDGTYSLTAILHSLVIIFFVMAAKGINNDEKLIRDSDRLR